MDALADDCLLRIFQFLTILERVLYERVCDHWRRLLRSTYADTRSLDVVDFMTRMYKTNYHTDSINLTPTVVGILKRCGQHLRQITFGTRWLKVSQSTIDTIAECCTKLIKLDLGCVILHADIKPALRVLAPRLIYFSLDESHWIEERDAAGIENVLYSMRNLEILHLKRVPFALSSLERLSENLRVINLNGARHLTPDSLHAFLLTHPILEELHLCSFVQIEQTTLDIVGSMQNLHILEINCVNREDLDLSCLANLKVTLKELHLQNNNSASDAAFRRICNECNELRALDLYNCRRFYDYGALAYCRALTRLNVGKTPQICDADLIDLAATNANLESLTLNQCVNVGTMGILAVAQTCPLREICVSHCPAVDDAALIGLIENHRPICTISLQNCRITNDGVAALAKIDGSILSRLRELDISYNRSINDGSIMAVYHALANSPYKPNRRAVQRKSSPLEADNRPTVHVHQTNVSKKLAQLVDDRLRLVF